MRLCDELRALDRAQHPELYDSDKRYHPDNEATSLDALTTKQARSDASVFEPVADSAPPDEAIAPIETPTLADALKAAQIHPASQAVVLDSYAQFDAAAANGPLTVYGVSKMFGQCYSATSTAMAAVELRVETAERAGVPIPPEKFTFHRLDGSQPGKRGEDSSNPL